MRQLAGEPVCRYLLEATKANGRANLGSAIPVYMVERVREVYSEIQDSPGRAYLRSRLKRAAGSSSRIQAGMALHDPAAA